MGFLTKHLFHFSIFHFGALGVMGKVGCPGFKVECIKEGGHLGDLLKISCYIKNV